MLIVPKVFFIVRNRKKCFFLIKSYILYTVRQLLAKKSVFFLKSSKIIITIFSGKKFRKEV